MAWPIISLPSFTLPYPHGIGQVWGMVTPFVDGLVPVALDHTYSYRVPRGMELAPGDIVAVPLGARQAIGVVWADDVTIKPGLHNRMKDVELKLEYSPLRPELRKFVD
jgi:primosomal protein N' (replication factor Y)